MQHLVTIRHCKCVIAAPSFAPPLVAALFFQELQYLQGLLGRRLLPSSKPMRNRSARRSYCPGKFCAPTILFVTPLLQFCE